MSFEQCATAHFTRYWQATPRPRQLTAGRYHELPSWFRVLEFQRERTWRYATAGMSEGESDGLEAFVIVRDQNLRAVELLYALAHFHRTAAPLNFGHTVNLAKRFGTGQTWITASCRSPMLRRTGSTRSNVTVGRPTVPG